MEAYRNFLARSKGFTLLELLVVLAVVAALATIALFAFKYALMAGRDAKRAGIMHDLQFAQELYKIRNGQYYDEVNDFCGLVGVLVSGNYLSYTPIDPRTKVNACGTDNPLAGGARYFYEATPSSQTYILKLGKEAGGSLDFLSPQ